GFGLFLAVFASAGLIPTIFEPGRIELLLSKPVRRHHILLGRYLGNVLVIAFNMLYLVLAVWLILGIKTDIWTHQFLYGILLTIFVFAVLLTIVLLIGVLSESAVLATMVTFGVMIVGLIVAQKTTLERLLASEWSRNVVRVLYHALPKVFDLGDIGRKLVIGTPIEDWTPLWSTGLFGVIVLGAGLFAFSRRNY
ncbi:MAG TPA: ABC transporter permease subunit, partial [Bryobacteraceae bacterium]|nr:ABC transporter permease subunit [Bryobacteraceae bacterium]